jgi:hypothetical protein
MSTEVRLRPDFDVGFGQVAEAAGWNRHMKNIKSSIAVLVFPGWLSTARYVGIALNLSL